MNWKELVEKYHDEKLKQNGHVYLLFNDGELISTKGGELFGQRNFHQFQHPILSKEEAFRFEMPNKCGDMSYCCVPSTKAANSIRLAMLSVVVEGVTRESTYD
jgi:hypothetical protein